MNFPEHLLNCGGYNLELENNNEKKRVGIYIKFDVKYERRLDLEKSGFHIVILDIYVNTRIIIINVYRTFRPPNGCSPDQFFNDQLDIVKKALCSNVYVLGDFNLDVRMSDINDYQRKNSLSLLNDLALNNNLIQIINFATWSRILKGAEKSLF